jgi:hypothetical protein
MPTQEDIERAIANNKSYVTSAVITFFLYWLCFFPGLIFNILYIKEAYKTKEITGQSPTGYGCLVTLFFLGMLPGIFLFLFLLLAIIGSHLK